MEEYRDPAEPGASGVRNLTSEDFRKCNDLTFKHIRDFDRHYSSKKTGK
ncbi:hypothetical protein HOA55_05090 [archaeon]|jgi:hypothetical protein|nr:hypothetical protein [archaeon]MBT3578156.1 hypothetical protein [archaeon]MBT6820704.1 hypothetical protein [archaeon]MBT6956706.1 hypothetical protein [archaeon]MBT7024887.1 hypothetical protein [archaeon]